ncbi:hypothetical protein RB598_009834 [Gaeumannomyces tritici]
MDSATLSRRPSVAAIPASGGDDVQPASPIPVDPRSPRVVDRPPSLHGDEAKVAATAELASIMTAASNPVSPGPASPPLLDPTRSQDFVPPARPSSTPFPQPEPRNSEITCTSCPARIGDGMDMEHDHDHDHDHDDGSGFSPFAQPVQPQGIDLNDLPPEIHECILDHLFGYRVSAASKSSMGMNSVTRSWGTALRHSRRRELSELALVSRVWRVLIQERLYRHIKLKATVGSVNDAVAYFAQHPHLRSYVRHIEVWFPVFQPKHGPSVLFATSVLPTVTVDGLTAASYVLPADNCSLEEAFYFVGATFPKVRVLTLEGGERKKAPKVRHFIGDAKFFVPHHSSPQSGPSPSSSPYIPSSLDIAREMPKVPTIRTLVCKGQWNLIRSEDDFAAIASALPNLEEWHGSYNKPKSKSYLTMAAILPHLPNGLKKVHLCLEADYRRELSFPPYFIKVSSRLHFCQRLGLAAPGLEHISYTGRVCRVFFDTLAANADPRLTRLKSIDLTVKNCCRQVTHWNESGSGITDMKFIQAFEALVLAGIRALKRLRALEYLRIRYVDLDSPIPSLNPYFILNRDGWVEGVWSDSIVRTLQAARPEARFRELADGPNKDGRMIIGPEYMGKVVSFKLDNYKYLYGGAFTGS